MADIIIWNSYSFRSHSANVMLSEFPSTGRPSGPHQLSVWLSKFGYDVKVIDSCHAITVFDLIKLTEKHITDKTIGIGVSTTFWHNLDTDIDSAGYAEPIWLAEPRKLLQNKYPKLEWLLGGPAAMPGSNYRFKWKKFVDNAEDTLLIYLDHLRGVKLNRPIFDIKDLDFHYGDNSSIKSHEVLSMQLGRGCQFACSFCNYRLIGKKKGTYIRKYHLIEEELLSNYYRFGTTRYAFTDDTINETEDKVIALAEIASGLPFKLEWVGFNRVDLIASRPNSIELLKASGMKSTFFGIESFHPKASLAVGKGWNGKNAKDFLLKLKDEWKDDVTFSLGLIAGLPGEDRASLDETNKWCHDNDMNYWAWSGLMLRQYSPGHAFLSKFERNASEYGYSLDPDPYVLNKWTSDLWDNETARAVAAELNKDGNKRIPCWWIPSLSVTLKESFDNIKNRRLKDVDRSILEKLYREEVDTYVKDQLGQ